MHMVRGHKGYVLGGFIASLMLVALACSLFEGAPPTEAPPPTRPPTALPAQPSETVQAPGLGELGSSTAELAKAAVKIFAMVREGDHFNNVWVGSGSVISPEGLILTNGHVVDNRYDEYTDLGVALTSRTDQPPELAYLAEIAAVDYRLDLAVIRIVSDLEGAPVSVRLPYVPLGDSDMVEIGDDLRILGYPVIGGATITFTEGVLSGFTAERGIEGRAWIKTDAPISGGNSGGMGVNLAGELIGIPTLASSGAETEDIVDCRPVVDTNRDGSIDQYDTCVPIGGFINGLRPVNLARPLVEAAIAGRQYVEGNLPESPPPGGFDLSNSDFYHLQFATDVTPEDMPAEIVTYLPGGATKVCAFWDYEGMIDGMTWSAYWFVNGELSEGGSLISQSWDGGDSGSWWVCTFNAEEGLEDGLYELVLEVEKASLASDSIYLGGNRNLEDFDLVNQSSVTICYVRLSPSEAQNWGPDRLGGEEVIDPGFTRTFYLASGVYDLQLLDCDLGVLLEDYGLDVTGGFTYTMTD